MLFPYEYRGATIEPMYEPTFDDEGYPLEMGFIAYVQHPAVEAIASFTAPTLEAAKEQAETAVDELLESWN